MTLDSTQQRFGSSLNFEYSAPAQTPAFSNPWSSASSPSVPASSGSGLFMGNNHQGLSHSLMAAKSPHSGRASTSSTSSIASYASLPVPNPPAGRQSPEPLQPPLKTNLMRYRSSQHQPHANHFRGLWGPNLHHYRISSQPSVCSYLGGPLRSLGLRSSPRSAVYLCTGSGSRSLKEILSPVSSPWHGFGTTELTRRAAFNLMIEGVSQTPSMRVTGCLP